MPLSATTVVTSRCKCVEKSIMNVCSIVIWLPYTFNNHKLTTDSYTLILTMAAALQCKSIEKSIVNLCSTIKYQPYTHQYTLTITIDLKKILVHL